MSAPYSLATDRTESRIFYGALDTYTGLLAELNHPLARILGKSARYTTIFDRLTQFCRCLPQRSLARRSLCGKDLPVVE